MADFIPFAGGTEALKLVVQFYENSALVRIPLECAANAAEVFPHRRLWIDPCVDGCEGLEKRTPKGDRVNAWLRTFDSAPHMRDICNSSFQLAPDEQRIKSFVDHMLDLAAAHKPGWITVPQLPHSNQANRSKVNRAFARAAGSWRSRRAFAGKLVLPVILTDPEQSRTKRRPRVELTTKCFAESSADVLWVVDSSLNDQSGSQLLRTEKIPGLIKLHEELNEAITPPVRIAGPYWALNLILWARGLIDHPCIGVSGGYQYKVSGELPFGLASIRVPLPPLRRLAKASPELNSWIQTALTRVPKSMSAHAELLRALQVSGASSRSVAKRELAIFYKDWCRLVSDTPPAGRALAMFQDLSSAFAFGKTVLNNLAMPEGDLPKEPGAVAEQLMMLTL